MSKKCQLVVFSNKAYNAIIRESFDKDPVETGGILLGHILDNGVWIVMEVLPPGINSIFQYAYFEYDEEFVNYLAQSVANQYKLPLDLLGLWHRHPGSMDVFSSTDDGTNDTFARQNPAGVISGLVNIDPKFRVTMYHLEHHSQRIIGRPEYEVVDVEVGDDVIPGEYFELRYYDGDNSELHPTVTSKVVDRKVNNSLGIDQIERSVFSQGEQQVEPNTDSLDIQSIINRGLPPIDESPNVSPNSFNDFFPFWRTLNKKKVYVLIAVIALIVFVCSLRTYTRAVIKGLDSKECVQTFSDEKVESHIVTTRKSLEVTAFVDTSKTYEHRKMDSLTVGHPFLIPLTKVGNPNVTFQSSNSDVADVDADGVVKPKQTGKTEIFVLCDGKQTDKFIVNVK